MQKTQLAGKVFGRLVVINEAPSYRGRARWNCRCSCGVTKIVSAAKLVSGGVRSCGCLRVDTSRDKALKGKIGGYKGYRKYVTVNDLLANTNEVNGCREWKGSLHRNGYAKIGKTTMFLTPLLHREVFRMVRGFYPEVVMHTCDNPKCINPDHLVGGTQKDNMLDMVSKNRKHNQFK